MKKLLLGLGLAWAALAQEWVAQEIDTIESNDKVKQEIVMQQDSTNQELAKTITFDDATRFMNWNTDTWEWTWIEPDPVLPDDSELEPTDWWKDTEKEQVSKTKFVVSTWVWYDLWNWLFMMNRISWNGTFFTWTKWEIRAYAHIDYDDPMHSKWSWKLSLWKTIYKWISLEWDYTFTWTWWNSVRVWLWYAWKLGDWQYAINVYPLNSSWSPVTFKVSFWTPLWKHWYLSTFVNGDYNKLKNLGYYSETKYSHDISNLINGVALFAQLRLWWTLDWQFTDNDFQSIRVWFDISVK